MCHISAADEWRASRRTNSLIAGRIRCAYREKELQRRRDRSSAFLTKRLADQSGRLASPARCSTQIDRGNGAGLGLLQFVNASGGEDVAPPPTPLEYRTA